jgi:hypothetical protein
MNELQVNYPAIEIVAERNPIERIDSSLLVNQNKNGSIVKNCHFNFLI